MTGQLTWDDLAGAVADASYRLDTDSTAGFGDSDADSDAAAGSAAGAAAVGAATAAAASILDAAITAVTQRRRHSTNRQPDVPLDRRFLDAQTLGDLHEFLQHCRKGLLTADEIGQEARMWEEILQAGWPASSRDVETVLRAVDLLRDVPPSGMEPPPLTAAEPANDLERAMEATLADESARPALWSALFASGLVLPVVAYELIRPEGAHFQFLTVPYSDTPLVLGFANEDRFRDLMPPGAEISLVEPPGHHLPKVWPEGHWLMINPGYTNSVVLSPWEITGLPDGPRSELPKPSAVQFSPPEDDDPRRSVLLDTLRQVPSVGSVAWSRVRPARALPHIRWQDVLVITAASGDEADELAAVQAFNAALPPTTFQKAITTARQPSLAHPFIHTALTHSHHLTSTPTRPSS
jgi:hypothetical protein